MGFLKLLKKGDKTPSATWRGNS